jgi:hypothetical protein
MYTVYTSNKSSYAYISNDDVSVCIYFDRTFYINSNPLPVGYKPTVTTLSHTSRIAGVGEVLTITGNHFGTTPGKVYFKSADDGGQTYLKGLDNQYISSWSNTQIKVIVPSASAMNKKAATGGSIRRSYLAREQCVYDYQFTYTWNYSISCNVPANQYSFYHAIMHELGHILLLGHVNDTTQLMYWQLKITGNQNINITPAVSAAEVELERGINYSSLPPLYVDTRDMPTSYHTTTCVLSIRVTDANGCIISGSPPSAKNLQLSENLTEETNNEIIIYPNPTTGTFSISNITNATVYLYSTVGTLLKIFEHVNNHLILNIENLSNGIYFLKIVEENRMIHKKLIINY